MQKHKLKPSIWIYDLYEFFLTDALQWNKYKLLHTLNMVCILKEQKTKNLPSICRAEVKKNLSKSNIKHI